MPATIRYRTKLITVSYNPSDEMNMLLNGGLLENVTATINALRADFGKRLPRERDIIEIQQRNGKFLELEVKKVPNLSDPNDPGLSIQLGTPEQ